MYSSSSGSSICVYLNILALDNVFEVVLNVLQIANSVVVLFADLLKLLCRQHKNNNNNNNTVEDKVRCGLVFGLFQGGREDSFCCKNRKIE